MISFHQLRVSLDNSLTVPDSYRAGSTGHLQGDMNGRWNRPYVTEPESIGIDSVARRRGITIIEVMVVIAVMSLLFALVLPGVLSVRERARRLQCSQHLRQLLVAFHGYHDTYGVLPSPTLTLPLQTYITCIFPYIEQPVWQPLFPTVPLADRIPLFLCPSDSIPSSAIRPINYLANCGPRYPDYKEDGIVANWSNQGGTMISLAAFTDGVSNTAALSEHLANRSTSATQTSASPANQYIWDINPTGMTGSVSDNDIYVFHCEGGPQSLLRGATASITNWSGDVATNRGRYTHALQPNTPRCALPPFIGIEPFVDYYTAARSLHRGGVNVGMVDGSVRFVGDSIDRQVWRATGTRSSSDGISVSSQ